MDKVLDEQLGAEVRLFLKDTFNRTIGGDAYSDITGYLKWQLYDGGIKAILVALEGCMHGS